MQLEHPLRQEMAEQEASAEELSLVARGPMLDSQQPIRRKAILVIDDEPGVAEVLAEVFSQDYYTVSIATNGEEALEKLQQQRYDAIMCDIRMPRMNGSAFYRAIEKQAPQLLCRVLFVTGDILSPETRQFLRQTGAPVLEKPFTFAEIRKSIQQILHASEER
jgi:two-component system NtrC family sensor kinase